MVSGGSTVGMAARVLRALRARGHDDADHWDLAMLRRALAVPQGNSYHVTTTPVLEAIDGKASEIL